MRDVVVHMFNDKANFCNKNSLKDVSYKNSDQR